MKRKTAYQTQHHGSHGFTLIEILITLAIIAIVAMISSPVIQDMTSNMRLKAAGRDLYSTLQNAKMLAIKENKNISVIFSATQHYTDEDGSGTYTAGEPRIIFEDYDNDANAASDAKNGVDRFVPAADNDWGGNAIVQAGNITFTNRGIASATGSIFFVNRFVNTDYAQLKDDGELITAYGVDVRSTGLIKLYKYNGTLPMVAVNWK